MCSHACQNREKWNSREAVTNAGVSCPAAQDEKEAEQTNNQYCSREVRVTREPARKKCKETREREEDQANGQLDGDYARKKVPGRLGVVQMAERQLMKGTTLQTRVHRVRETPNVGSRQE